MVLEVHLARNSVFKEGTQYNKNGETKSPTTKICRQRQNVGQTAEVYGAANLQNNEKRSRCENEGRSRPFGTKSGDCRQIRSEDEQERGEDGSVKGMGRRFRCSQVCLKFFAEARSQDSYWTIFCVW